MDGEIDLELYTISMIRLNSIFQKIEDNNIATDIIPDIENCFKSLRQLLMSAIISSVGLLSAIF